MHACAPVLVHGGSVNPVLEGDEQARGRALAEEKLLRAHKLMK